MATHPGVNDDMRKLQEWIALDIQPSWYHAHWPPIPLPDAEEHGDGRKMITRRVKVYKYERKQEGGRSYLEKVENGFAIFHAWGVDYEELEHGPGSYSTAIVEREDGTVENVPAELVQFTEK